MLVQATLSDEVIKETAKVKCEICGKEFEQITATHLKTHGINMHEYREKFPDASLISEGCRKKFSCENNGMFGKGYLVAGEKAPMYGRTGDKCPVYKGGISFLPYCEKFDDDLKERVRKFFNRCCYVCGKSEQEQIDEMIKEGKRPVKVLDVHHVNYNKMVCCNDVKPLFVPLCRSCHAKTHFDREYWEEFFTISLEYLTNGKCFLPKKR